MPKDPFLNFISDLSAKIQVSREHKHIMDRVNTPGSVADESKASLENLILTIKEKIEKTVPKDAVEPLVSTEVLPVTSSFVKVVSEEENNFTEFVDKIKNILSKPKIESVKTDAAAVSAAPALSAHESPADTKKYVTGLDVPKKENIKTKKYVNELEKVKDNIQIEKEDTKVTEIKKLIEEYAEKYIKKAMVMAEYAGGGGTNAVQYVNGGVMNGDLNVKANYLSGGVNLLDIFALQPDLDKQTLSYNDANYDLSISGGNTVNLSAINTTFNANSSKYESNYTTTNTNSANWSSVYTTFNSNSAKYDSNYTTTNNNSANWSSAYTNVNSNSAYYALTNQDTIFEQDVTIQGNLTALGTSTFQNTVFTTTTALSVVNTGTGPALYVFQAAGPYDVASFYDGDGVEVLHVGNAQGGGNPLGQVGINTSFPSAELTVNGAISSNGVITVLDGNSNQWNSNYTTTNTNSANWSSVYTTVNTNSANYILDGGNTKGANIVVGSNDSFNLNIETNNTNRISILSSGETKFLTKYSLLSTAVPSVEFSSGIIVGADVATLSSYNTPTGYNIGQFSTNGLLIGQSDVGVYIGRTNVKENLFSLPNIENNFVTKLNTSIGNFQDLSISSDGRYITICNYRNSNLNGVLYTSNNFGSSFTARTINGDVTKGWLCTAMSIDGKIQVASSFSSVETGIFVSADYGETWNLRFTQAAPFAICVSSDGRIQAAAVETLGGGGALRGVYMSYDFGENWVKKFDLALDFETIKMSSDGRIITAAVKSDGSFLGGGHIYTSHDFGNTWVQRTSSPRCWTRLAMSADGKNQSIVVEETTLSGPSTQLGVYVSNNYGITWNNTLPQVQACDICMTSSGKTQLVIRGVSFLNDIIVSNNYGASWSQLNTAPSTTLLYSYIVCSSDGKVIALGRTSYSGVGSSQLDVYYATFTTPNPITINNTISSSNIIFALQGNSTQWNSNYTTTNTNSGKWSSVYTTFNAQSANNNSVYTTVNANSAKFILSGGNSNSSNFSIGTNDAYNLNFETNNTSRITILSAGQVRTNYPQGISPGVYLGGIYVGYPVSSPKDNRYEGFYSWNSTVNRYVSGTNSSTQYYITSTSGGWELIDVGAGGTIAANADTSSRLVPPRLGWVNLKFYDIFDTPPTSQNIDYAMVVGNTLSANLIYTDYIGNNNNFVIERLGLKNLTITDNEGWRGGRTTISNTLCVAPADPANYFDQPNIFFSDAGLFHATGPKASEEYRSLLIGSNLTTVNGADIGRYSAGEASPTLTFNAGPEDYANRHGVIISNYTSVAPNFNQSDSFLIVDMQGDINDASYGTIKIGKLLDISGEDYVPITNARVQVEGGVNVDGIIRTSVVGDSLYTGNSNNWNSNYTTTNANSGKWSSVYTTFNANSAKYDSNYTSFNSNSAKYDSNWTITNSNSANWTQNRSIQTSNFAASQGSYYIVDTTSAPITGALPASPTIGTTITFQDAFIKWQTNNFTLSTNGNMIQGLNENMICDRGGVMFDVTYIGASIGWRVN